MPERWMYDEAKVLHIFGMTGRTFDPYGPARSCSLAPVVSLQMSQNILECPYIRVRTMDVVTFIWHDAAIIAKSKIGVSASS